MRELDLAEGSLVSGGDASATRLPGTNSWGQALPQTTQSACYTVQLGANTSQTCYNNDGSKTITKCVEVGAGANVGGIGVRGSAGVCESTTYPSRYGLDLLLVRDHFRERFFG